MEDQIFQNLSLNGQFFRLIQYSWNLFNVFFNEDNQTEFELKQAFVNVKCVQIQLKDNYNKLSDISNTFCTQSY